MGVQLSRAESAELYSLLAEDSGDILFKTDRAGFIVDASPAIAQIGIILPEMLIGPHLADLVHPARSDEVRRAHSAVIAGRRTSGGIEFPVYAGMGEERWFELSLRAVSSPGAEPYGALGLLRDIDQRKRHEQELFAAEMTDPLTGLTNRRAFMAMLEHMIDSDFTGSIGFIDIDHFKAINMKHGHCIGDEVLVLFADFVRRLARSSDIVSRVGGETLGILMPGSSTSQAEANCRRIVSALAGMRHDLAGETLTLTASAGIARIAGTLDATIQRAEMALFLAKAKGRNRLECDLGLRLAWNEKDQAA
ncbi:MAG: GGDEF domain-containing protein [Novosphingobium sp.]